MGENEDVVVVVEEDGVIPFLMMVLMLVLLMQLVLVLVMAMVMVGGRWF